MKLKHFLPALFIIIMIAGCSNPSSSSGYTAGDTGPTGGTILYVNPNAAGDGWTYLEAAPNSIGTRYKFCDDSSIDFDTSTAIGTGKENTEEIRDNSTSSAANQCDIWSYTNSDTKTTYTDWFLPSRDEFELLTKYKSINSDFWTSSESPSHTYAYSWTHTIGSTTYDTFLFATEDGCNYDLWPMRRF